MLLSDPYLLEHCPELTYLRIFAYLRVLCGVISLNILQFAPAWSSVLPLLLSILPVSPWGKFWAVDRGRTGEMPCHFPRLMITESLHARSLPVNGSRLCSTSLSPQLLSFKRTVAKQPLLSWAHSGDSLKMISFSTILVEISWECFIIGPSGSRRDLLKRSRIISRCMAVYMPIVLMWPVADLSKGKLLLTLQFSLQIDFTCPNFALKGVLLSNCKLLSCLCIQLLQRGFWICDFVVALGAGRPLLV